MMLNEYYGYIRNPLAEAKVRVVTVPLEESWTSLRRFYQEFGGIELRLSDLIRDAAWLPMPDEVFGRVHDAMRSESVIGKTTVLLGLPGYLDLLTDENKRAAIVAIREWMDDSSGMNVVCLLRADDGTEFLLRDVFANPRYVQGKQLIEIHDEQRSQEGESIDDPMEVMLVGEDLVPLIPDACETFRKYLRNTEENFSRSSVHRIVIASGGRTLAGLSVEVRQMVCLRDFAARFYGVKDTWLSDAALRWMCERGKKGVGKTLTEILKNIFFPENEILVQVLSVFDGRNGAEREALLWLIKRIATKRSYLEHVLSQEGVFVNNFRSAYVTGPAEWLGLSDLFALERRAAILKSDVKRSSADIYQFINRCMRETSSRVSPWLNCGTIAERAELLRRCAVECFVSKTVKKIYPEAAAYLNAYIDFEDQLLGDYFREYRELKMTNCLTPEFSERALREVPPSSVSSRDAIVQEFVLDKGCALLVVDAMGAEWLPMLVALARERNIGVDFIRVGEAHLPSTTRFNHIYWPHTDRRLPDIKRFDNIVHNGVEAHEIHRAEENLSAALAVIGEDVLPRVAEGLSRFERVLVTADHGSSRLAVIASQAKVNLARTLACHVGSEIADWRYCERDIQCGCTSELEETLDGRYLVVRGYNRLPKKGGGQSFEVHGGATLEERIVPVVMFSTTGKFGPTSKTEGKHLQIIEKDDFDI